MDDFQLKIILSLLSLGFFGSFSHCGFMCGPFVLMQVNNNLSQIKITNVTYLKKLKGLALLPYHCGRIITYSFLGFVSAFFGKNIRTNGNANLISAIMLTIGALLILEMILKNFKINLFTRIPSPKKKIPIDFLPLKPIKIIKDFLSFLFKNPQGLRGFILGLILGFIPCGLLYSSLIISATLDNYIIAGMAMLIFGIATIPALFISGSTGYLFFNKSQKWYKFFTQFILLINMISLFIMSASQIKLI